MPRRDRVYIAGPMTGLPEFNYPLFRQIAGEWRAAGWEVINPAESFGGRTDLPYERYMRNAIRLVMRATAIALLPGWERSKGAQMEVLLGIRQGYEFFDAVTGRHIDPPVLIISVG